MLWMVEAENKGRYGQLNGAGSNPLRNYCGSVGVNRNLRPLLHVCLHNSHTHAHALLLCSFELLLFILNVITHILCHETDKLYAFLGLVVIL